MSLAVLMSVYYNDEPQFLSEAILSIWDNQTLKPDEIILVEDGELPTELYKVIANWQKKLGHILKIIPLETNFGLARALNVGIDHSSCEYIARMDADDISAPDRFEKQIRFLQENPQIMVLGGSIQEFSANNTKICIRYYPDNNERAKEYIVKASPLAHATVIFRKAIFDQGLRYSEKYKTSQDIDLWFRVLKMNYNITSIRDVTYYVRVSEDFFKRRSFEKSINEFKIYWTGILSLYGLTPKLIFPVIRLFFRLSPEIIVRKAYAGKIRALLNK